MSSRGAAALKIVLALLLASCVTSTQIGAVAAPVPCASDDDCAPPSTICGFDGRCIRGCRDDADSCVAGTTCNAATGQCSAGGTSACTVDGDCEPPDLVCHKITHRCVPGCDADPDACWGGLLCRTATGHCCDPTSDPTCHGPPDMGPGCLGDSDCAAHAGTVCAAGQCVPGCTATGCTMPLTCTASGHCGPSTGTCARDADCAAESACDQAGACFVLAHGGESTCAGGAIDRTSCNQLDEVSAWESCVGAPGGAGCPYCVEGSCMYAGVCASDADCHGGDGCTKGLCWPRAPACPSTVSAADVLAGRFAAGHEVCVRDVVAAVSMEYDGNALVRLGTVGLAALVTPLYRAQGLPVPDAGATVTVHAKVRWNDWHHVWELRPVDGFY